MTMKLAAKKRATKSGARTTRATARREELKRAVKEVTQAAESATWTRDSAWKHLEVAEIVRRVLK